MIRSTATQTLLRVARNCARPALNKRLFTQTAVFGAKDPKMSTDPPKHEMQYFPNMTSALPSESAEFRRVLWTGLYSQVVLMTVPVGGDIGDEVHTVDQALTFTSGVGKATIAGKDQDVKAGDLMVVPAGTQHQFVNTGPTPLVRNDARMSRRKAHLKTDFVHHLLPRRT